LLEPSSEIVTDRLAEALMRVSFIVARLVPSAVVRRRLVALGIELWRMGPGRNLRGCSKLR
jgi:hypothetical protein